MFKEQVRIQSLLGSENMNVCDRAKGEDGHRSSPGPFSWYLAQRALPELNYVLTSSGYVVLP